MIVIKYKNQFHEFPTAKEAVSFVWKNNGNIFEYDCYIQLKKPPANMQDLEQKFQELNHETTQP